MALQKTRYPSSVLTQILWPPTVEMCQYQMCLFMYWCLIYAYTIMKKGGGNQSKEVFFPQRAVPRHEEVNACFTNTYVSLGSMR